MGRRSRELLADRVATCVAAGLPGCQLLTAGGAQEIFQISVVEPMQFSINSHSTGDALQLGSSLPCVGNLFEAGQR
jgi:hypothetical protein